MTGHLSPLVALEWIAVGLVLACGVIILIAFAANVYDTARARRRTLRIGAELAEKAAAAEREQKRLITEAAVQATTELTRRVQMPAPRVPPDDPPDA